VKKVMAEGIASGNGNGKGLDMELSDELDLNETPPPPDIPAKDILPPGGPDVAL
jgi:hypothetical protein